MYVQFSQQLDMINGVKGFTKIDVNAFDVFIIF